VHAARVAGTVDEPGHHDRERETLFHLGSATR
jgi:hypothetical protein